MRSLNFYSLGLATAVSLFATTCLPGTEVDEAPVAGKIAVVLWKADETITLPVEEKPTFREIAFPALKEAVQGHLALRFRARFHWPKQGGLSRSLALALNGKAFSPEATPVLNRTAFTYDGAEPREGQGWWMRTKGLWCLVLHYSPDAMTLEPKLQGNEEEGQWYLIKVEGLFHPGEANVLKLSNHATLANWPKGPASTQGIIVEELALVELE